MTHGSPTAHVYDSAVDFLESWESLGRVWDLNIAKWIRNWLIWLCCVSWISKHMSDESLMRVCDLNIDTNASRVTQESVRLEYRRVNTKLTHWVTRVTQESVGLEYHECGTWISPSEYKIDSLSHESHSGEYVTWLRRVWDLSPSEDDLTVLCALSTSKHMSHESPMKVCVLSIDTRHERCVLNIDTRNSRVTRESAWLEHRQEHAILISLTMLCVLNIETNGSRATRESTWLLKSQFVGNRLLKESP